MNIPNSASMLLLILLAALMTGCSNKINIEEFSIEGSTADINDVAQISYDEDFQVRWTVSMTMEKLQDTNEDQYSVELFLSDNDSISTTDDLLFYDETCGTSSSPSQCESSETGSVTCSFISNDNTEIECVGDSGVLPDALLDDLVTNGAYIILRACHGIDSSECDSSSGMIKLN